jgi:hypothetical protein
MTNAILQDSFTVKKQILFQPGASGKTKNPALRRVQKKILAGKEAEDQKKLKLNNRSCPSIFPETARKRAS